MEPLVLHNDWNIKIKAMQTGKQGASRQKKEKIKSTTLHEYFVSALAKPPARSLNSNNNSNNNNNKNKKRLLLASK